jgi:hypothetical protein
MKVNRFFQQAFDFGKFGVEDQARDFVVIKRDDSVNGSDNQQQPTPKCESYSKSVSVSRILRSDGVCARFHFKKTILRVLHFSFCWWLR